MPRDRLAGVTEATARGEVLVDRRCGEAVLRGANVFVPGVRAATPGILAEDRVLVSVDLDGRVGRGGDAAADIPKAYIGTGRVHMTRAQIMNGRTGVAVTLDSRVYDSPPLNGVFPDWLYLQNLSSLVVTHVLDPQPGDRIIDMCSSPGGKTSHVASRLRGRGSVVAIDRSPKKVDAVRRVVEQLGLQNVVKCYAQDSKKLVDWDSERANNSDDEVREQRRSGLGKQRQRDLGIRFPAESFDRVLLDPTCSGLGLRPRLRQDVDRALLRNCAQIQRDLLLPAVHLVRPGGTLVYSTCTVNPEENEANVAWVLSKFPGVLELVPQAPRIGLPGLPGCGLAEQQQQLVQRFDPSHDASVIGFFVAKFRKVHSSGAVREAAAAVGQQ